MRTIAVPLLHEERALGVLEVPEPILGVSAVEVLGFKIDVVNERLVRSRPYGPAIL